jgi:hypothetical protein
VVTPERKKSAEKLPAQTLKQEKEKLRLIVEIVIVLPPESDDLL